MATQFHLVEHGQELLSGSLGLQVGDHLGGWGKGQGIQQEGASNQLLFMALCFAATAVVYSLHKATRE